VTDLRTLAQAVVDASEMYHGERSASVGRDRAVIADCYTRLRDAGEALGHALGGCGLGGPGVATARAILTALDAADAQGYARAMGEVVERCQEPAPIRSGSARVRMAHAAGWGNAMCHVADWAIERCE
jgi:hypothetical protein